MLQHWKWRQDGSGILGLQYALLFAHVLVVWVGRHVGVVIVGVDVSKAVKDMAEAGGIFGLWFGEPG